MKAHERRRHQEAKGEDASIVGRGPRAGREARGHEARGHHAGCTVSCRGLVGVGFIIVGGFNPGPIVKRREAKGVARAGAAGDEG